MPGASQNVVPGGFASVLVSRSPWTAGSTVTAPAGAVAGPAGTCPQTAATFGVLSGGGGVEQAPSPSRSVPKRAPHAAFT